MSIAVIKAGGKQYKVKVGDILNIEKTDNKVGEKINFKDILGDKSVKSTVVEELVKGPKVRIFKYKSKTGYKRATGHRQKYTKIKIETIS